MRISVVTPSASRLAGGLYESVPGINKALATHGCNISVHSVRDRFSNVDKHKWGNLDLQLSNVYGPRKFLYSSRLSHSVMERHPDVIHQNSLWTFPSIVTRNISTRKSVPRVISPRGALDSWALRNSSFTKSVALALFERENVLGAQAVHVLSEQELRSVREFGYRGPVIVLPNGVGRYCDTALEAPSWRRVLPSGSNAILFLGRIHPKKNILNLIRAFSNVVKETQEFENWHLVIAGWEEVGYLNSLHAVVAECSCQNKIHFVGSQFGEEKKKTLMHADGFILPSLSEGVPMAVLEAWSAGLPVLMTSHCNLPIGFQSGAAFEVGTDIDSISSGLRYYFSLPDPERAAMGAKGQELAGKRFSWGAIGLEMKAAYEWLLGGGSAPSFVDRN